LPSIPPVQQARDTVVVRDTVVIVKEVPGVAEPEIPRETALYFEGRISDSESGNPISARLEISEFSTEALIATATSSETDGFFRTILPGRKIYLVNMNAQGFLPELKKIAVPESFTGDSFSLDFTMERVSVGKKVVLNNILFELGKSVLTKGSYVEIDRLVSILQENPLMKIEISGHTDNTGNPVVNARLSTERARAVVDYIVSKGIDKNRLNYRGYGSEQPIGDNSTAEGRTMNRRVEFKILEF
jgi:outer membrane protein OmpA-like peptidoglycan-associated protein